MGIKDELRKAKLEKEERKRLAERRVAAATAKRAQRRTRLCKELQNLVQEIAADEGLSLSLSVPMEPDAQGVWHARFTVTTDEFGHADFPSFFYVPDEGPILGEPEIPPIQSDVEISGTKLSEYRTRLEERIMAALASNL